MPTDPEPTGEGSNSAATPQTDTAPTLETAGAGVASASEDVGVVFLNFGEPPTPDREQVIAYLERIFLANADLEGDQQPRERAQTLARRRAPGLIDEYTEIGGSPLNEQAREQVRIVTDRLAERGYEVESYLGMQYTEPLIETAVERARADGVDRLVGVPIYPLCGHSTNVAALDELEDAVETAGWEVPIQGLTGWHRHPAYTRLRAENLAEFLEARDLAIGGETALVFSAHGTPVHYLEGGSRYDVYVEEFCETIAAMLGIDEYAIGYQNHENRDIDWTEPELEELVAELDADRAVIEPISFLHEQSETLVELDIDLREDAPAELEVHRVPIPYDDPRIGDVIADLLEPLLASFDPGYYQLRQCQCRDEPGTVCLNAPRNPQHR